MIRNITSFIKLKPALAVGFLFATSSLLFATWVAAIPDIKERMHFRDDGLGASLLFSPLGALTGVALSTRIFSKIAVGKWMYWGYSAICLMMILQINSASRVMLWATLYCFGLISFLNGVSANTTVSRLEKQYNRKLMSTCHGMYSLGGFVSAGFAALLFAFHVPSRWQIVIVATTLLIVLRANRRHLLAHTEVIHSRSGLKFPSLSILGISFICMMTFMAEGCVADWSAVYLKESLHCAKEIVSLGYAAFAIAMTVGRFNGDTLIARVGGKRMVIGGALLAAFGFLLVALAPYVIVAILGYLLVGCGCCCIVPVLFSASATIPGVSTVEGFAMVTTGGLIGFLTGPSVIGFISRHINLSTGFLLLVILAITAAFVAWRNNFLGSKGNEIKSLKTELQYDEQIY